MSMRQHREVWTALALGAATTAGVHGGEGCPPAGPNLIVEEYAAGLCDIRQLAFGDDQSMYVGNGGCGGLPSDPAWVRRIPPGGGSFENFGPQPIPDPDSVLVDRPGSVSAPGSVLVGHWPGTLVAIAPDGSSVSTIFSGNGQLINPTRLQLDINDRLLISNSNGAGGIYQIIGNAPALVIATPGGPQPNFTTGCDDRIYVADGIEGGIDVYELDGTFVMSIAEELGTFSRIECASGGPFGHAIYATQDGALLQIDPDTGDAVELGQVGFFELAFDDDGALYTSVGETIYRVTIGVEPCPFDVNRSGVTDVGDLIEMMLVWGTSDVAADINDDCIVDVLDLIELVLNWGNCP